MAALRGVRSHPARRHACVCGRPARTPATAAALEGRPVEEVVLFRDEMANLAWGVEDVLPNALGEPVAGHDIFLRAVRARPDSTATKTTAALRYRLMTDVAEHWLPFQAVRQPVRAAERSRLELTPFLREDPSGALVDIGPKGRILSPATTRTASTTRRSPARRDRSRGSPSAPEPPTAAPTSGSDVAAARLAGSAPAVSSTTASRSALRPSRRSRRQESSVRAGVDGISNAVPCPPPDLPLRPHRPSTPVVVPHAPRHRSRHRPRWAGGGDRTGAGPVRRVIPRAGMFDLSFLVVFFGISILRQVIAVRGELRSIAP